MKTINVFIGAVTILTLNLHAETTLKPLNELDALVGRWIKLRSAIAEEKQSWKDQESHLKSEISLLESETASLKKEIKASDSFVLRVEKEHAERLEQKKALESELIRLNGVLSKAESTLLKWRKRIPPSLREPLDAAFDSLPDKDKKVESQVPLTKRAQNVAALFSQIETLQNRYHVTRETVETDGKRRKADVLYLGLSMAFAVSPANDWGATGSPTESGWIWQTEGVNADAIRQAVNIYNRRETAQLVSLPIKISRGEDQ